MLYRRKILLALLQRLNREVDTISFQKILFLLTERQRSKSFNFIPYRFGCYSFQANAELKVLERDGYLRETNSAWKLTNNQKWSEELEDNDKAVLKAVVSEHGSWTRDQLIHWTYTKHSYYAINSEIIEKHLNFIERIFTNTARPVKRGKVLFTVGYEGITLEEYLNNLIKEDVKLLCDVRKNSVSMKYGFSRKTLEKACAGVKIQYRHMPELGIDSYLRHDLSTKQDYEKLFRFYDLKILPAVENKQVELLELVERYGRVAVTCFEKNPSFCHRSHLAAAIGKMSGSALEIRHL